MRTRRFNLAVRARALSFHRRPPLTLTGQYFASGARVTFGGTEAASVVVTATRITANTPAHAQGSVNVVLTNPDGQSATLTPPSSF